MADKIKFGRFVHSDAGVIAVTKGAGVRTWVATETARLTARANAATPAGAFDQNRNHTLDHLL